MKIEHTQVYGFESAIRGMRNPMNSWNRSDSFNYFDNVKNIDDIHPMENSNAEGFVLGDNDKELAQKLINAGSEHCKFLRMIQVWVDMELPRYIWSEFDTYKYNTKNSCSTMHKILSKPLTFDDFELDRTNVFEFEGINHAIVLINDLIKLKKSNSEEEINILNTIKRLLPEGYLQRRTVCTNYAELRNIYNQRKNHRLKEWYNICKWIVELPYADVFII